MNLYKIIIEHFSQKDSKTAIVTLLLAKNDEEVYEWIKSEPELGKDKLYNNWAYMEAESIEKNKTFNIYNEKCDIIGNETFKEKFIRIKGELNDEDFENADAYYGNTIYGWELVKENPTTDFSEMKELGLVYYYA